jgi:serine/threonine protein kinase
MEVVKLLLEKQYIHHDLKHNNIMVSNDLSLKMIDFGLMEYIPEYTKFCKNEHNNNPVALFEYFPFETEYYNVKNYNNHVAVANQQNYTTKITYLENKYQYFFRKFVKGEYDKQYNEMVATMDTATHDEFLNASFHTFDIYTIGITVIFLIEQYIISIPKRRTYSDFYNDVEYNFEYPEWLQFDKLRPLIVKMITPNVFKRIHIDDLLVEFEMYITQLTNTTPL